MTYNIRDVAGFPPPSRYRQTTIKDIVDEVSPDKVVPVSYAFGGAAPDAIILSDGSQILAGSVNNATRLFVEYSPYYWNPDSPDWNGQ
jgi:hypothetical protein